MTTATVPRPEPFADLEWLRSFAARLARDEADDLVQETVLTAIEHPPAQAPGRPWLATVMRNRLRMQRRSAGARRLREERAGAVEDAAAAPDTAAHRLSVLRVLVDRLESLPAADRQIIVARFFDGRNATEIGESLALDASTVRSRLRRSLQRLRTELDARFGGDRLAWAGAVGIPAAPMVAGSGGAAPLVLLSTHKAIVALGVLALGALLLWLRPAPSEPSSVEPDSVAAPPAGDRERDATARPAIADADDPEASWLRRSAEIRRAQQAARDPEVTGGDDELHERENPEGTEDLVDAAHSAQSQAVLECVEQGGRPLEGALVLRTRVLGAPDVGTIYESIEIVGETESSPELIECIQSAMYEYVGHAPATPFQTTSTVTHLGRSPEGQDEEVWKRRMFDSVVAAHLSEIRACETEADAAQPPVGHVSLAMAFDREPFATDVRVQASTVPEAVAACISEAASGWMFPRPVLAGHTFSRDFVLPTDAAVDGIEPDGDPSSGDG